MHPRSGPEGEPMRTSRISRRRFLATTAAASALVAMPHVRGSHAAGKLSLGLWDHWVPGANKAMDEICQAWAAKEKVDLSIDYFSTQGSKLQLTIAVEARSEERRVGKECRSRWSPYH